MPDVTDGLASATERGAGVGSVGWSAGGVRARVGYTAWLEAMMNELKTRLDALRGYL